MVENVKMGVDEACKDNILRKMIKMQKRRVFMDDPVYEWALRSIELYHRRIYNDAEEFINRGLDIVIRTRDNSLHVFEIVNEHMYSLVDDLDNVTEEEVRREFRRQLKYRMFLKYVTQADLADICEITQTAVSRYMTGDNAPNVFIVNKIANALGCTMNDLIFQKETYKQSWVSAK